ncbi:MAG: hypothetical protein WBA57_02320 [Elainellaceae cyanobacterium]
MDSQRSSADLIVFDGYQATPPVSKLGRLWKWLLKAASPDAWIERLAKFAYGSSDPVIEQRRDRQGYLYYRIYDPVSQEHHVFTTESEVRSWLERRYYH